jgi:RNA polymerase sigma factor (sigma-70 family)
MAMSACHSREATEEDTSHKACASRDSVVEECRESTSRSDISEHTDDDEAERLDRIELLSRLDRRDAAAWNAVISHNEPMLRALGRSYRLSQPDVENALQRTWLALLTHASGIRDARCLGSWLASTMRRECLRELRAAPRTRDRLVGDWSALEGCGTDDDEYEELPGLLDRRQLATTVWELVDRLPARQRCLLRALYGGNGLSYADVSARTGVPVGAIGPTRQRALRRLRTLIDWSTLADEWPTSEPALG